MDGEEELVGDLLVGGGRRVLAALAVRAAERDEDAPLRRAELGCSSDAAQLGLDDDGGAVAEWVERSLPAQKEKTED